MRGSARSTRKESARWTGYSPGRLGDGMLRNEPIGFNRLTSRRNVCRYERFEWGRCTFRNASSDCRDGNNSRNTAHKLCCAAQNYSARASTRINLRGASRRFEALADRQGSLAEGIETMTTRWCNLGICSNFAKVPNRRGAPFLVLPAMRESNLQAKSIVFHEGDI